MAEAYGAARVRVGEAPFVGRSAETALLDSVLDGLGLKEGGPALVDVTGEAGIGKSRLLARFRESARSRGLTVLSGKATEYEQHSPFGPFADAFADLDPSVLERFPALAQLSPVLRDAGAAPGAVDRFGLYQTTATVLGGLGRDRLVVTLDDLHWADPASLELLSHLVRRRVPSSPLLVISRRPRQTSPALPAALAGGLDAGTVLQIALGPLTERDCVEELADGLAPARALELYEASDGNPLYFLALRQADRGTHPISEPVSARTARAVSGEPDGLPAGPGELDSLTTRERQVAVLVAQGLTSRAIASRLRLSPRTVESHIARIYRKTGASSRAALASIVTRDEARDSEHSQARQPGPATSELAQPTARALPIPRPLPGRDLEVEMVTKALADLEAGKGRAIALVGEPGIGKSSLLWTAAAHARALGIPVLAARGGSAIVFSPSGEPGGLDVRKFEQHVAARTPVMTALEDLHELAADRVADVERLIGAADAGPVLCVLAYRPRQLSPPLAAALSRASSAGLLEVRSLGPLSREQSAELIGEHPHPDEVYREAEGNPQYMKVLAADDEAVVDAGTAILGELSDLDPTSMRVLETAAVLGRRFHPELLAAAADLELPAVMAALDALSRRDLVRPAQPAPRLALRHPAVGKVVYQRLEPGRRTGLHRRAEAELAERGAPVSERAIHIAKAADPGRPEHARILIVAARELLHTSPTVATSHLQVALSLLQEEGEHWYEAQVLLARSRLLTGDAAEGQAILGALRSELPGGSAGDATALADSSRIERYRGRYSEAGALARAGLAALTDSDSATAAALHAELADYAYDVQDYPTSQHHAETAAMLARKHGDLVGEANALGKAALGQLFTGDQATALATMGRAAELIDGAADATLVTYLETANQIGTAEGILGRLVDAERHLSRGAHLCRSTGQIYTQAQMLVVLANARLRVGNLSGTLATLEEADRYVDRAGTPGIEATMAALRAEALLWRGNSGDVQDALTAAERAMAIAEGVPTAWAVSVRCFSAEFVLHSGDPARAMWQLLDEAGGRDLPRFNAWRRPRWCDTLAEAAAHVGDHDSVEHWARLAEASLEQLPSAGRQGFAVRARMRACASHADIDRALLSAHAAINDFSGSGERIELGRTLIAAASLSLDADRTDAVSGWLDRAALLAERCGSARMAADVAAQFVRLATKD